MPRIEDYNKGLIFTATNKCIDCNKCIHGCPILKANVYVKDTDGTYAVCVDENECVLCGKCIRTCVHEVRHFKDDLTDFFGELKKGKKFSLLVAPSFFLNYPIDHKKIMGYLRSLGVNKFFSVGFGADITTWGYIKYLSENPGSTYLSQPCPVVVFLVEKRLPQIVQNIIPVQSPMMCTAIYLKKYMGVTDELAFLSPCIAKKVEIESKRGQGLIRHNITFKNLMDYIKNEGINLDDFADALDEIEYGMGSLFPKPGGLMENVEFYLGPKLDVMRVEGENKVYMYLKSLGNRLAKGDKRLPSLVDLLNCEQGCCYGTGVQTPDEEHSIEYETLLMRKKKFFAMKDEKHEKLLLPEERFAKLCETFSSLKLEDFLCTYDNDKAVLSERISEDVLDEVFNDMLKFEQHERQIDCSACGNKTCLDMAVAIAYGINMKTNCVYYLRDSLKNSIEEIQASRENSQAKSRFLARMSHEIRTPISAVLGISEIKLQDTSLSLDLEEAFAKIHSSANTLLGIVNDLLDLSKIEAGKIEISSVKYEVASLISDVVQLCLIYVGGKPIDLIVDVDETIPSHLFGDDLRIKQVLVNFLSNAFKYTDKGTVKLSVGFEQTDDPEKVNVIIEIFDTGYGMTDEQVKELFVEYSRFHENDARGVKGIGLGMPIALNLLQAMDAKLSVQSKVGEGTTARITLPQLRRSFEQLGAETAKNLKNFNMDFRQASKRFKFKPIPMPYGKVLIVDDVDTNIYVARGLLNLYKLQIESCDSGITAINRVRAGEVFDIIFMDQMMPEMNGTEATAIIREMGYKNPIVALTANALVGQAEEYLRSGFDGFLSKPIQSAHLHSILCKFIRDRHEESLIEVLIEQDMDALENEDVPSMEDYLMQPEMQAQIRADFLESQANVIRQISSAVLIHDIETAHRLVHTLKGIASLMFEQKLVDSAEAVEKVYKAGKLPEVHAIMNLENEFAKTYERIKTEERKG